MNSQRRSRIDWVAAVTAVTRQGNSLLPSRVLEAAASRRTEEVGNWLKNHFESGGDITVPETISASKSYHGFRPIQVVGLPERVLLHALVVSFQPELPVPERSDDAFETFKQSPLLESSQGYVASGDIASCYQYIDHGILERELVATSGDAAGARAIVEVLRTEMGRSIGLPQNLDSSHILADLYLDKIERRLIRRGQLVWRYNDDFLFAADSAARARAALELLDEGARSVGLVTNDSKSLIVSSLEHARWVNEPKNRRDQLNDSLAVDLDDWIQFSSEYSSEPEDDGVDDSAEPSTEAQVEGAVRVLDLWYGYLQQAGPRDPLDLHVNRRLARDAIRLLRRRDSPEGVRYCGALLQIEPQMTHTVARYLRRLCLSGHVEPVALIDGILSDSGTRLSPWQQLWMVDPLWRAAELTERSQAWLVQTANQSQLPSALRARAAFVLAIHQRVTAAFLGELYDELRPASRSDVVAGVAHLGEGDRGPVLRAMRSENLLNRLVVDFIEEVRGGS